MRPIETHKNRFLSDFLLELNCMNMKNLSDKKQKKLVGEAARRLAEIFIGELERKDKKNELSSEG